MTEWFDKRLAQLDQERDYDKLRDFTKTMSHWAEGLATCVWQLTEKPDDADLRMKCKRYFQSYVLNEDVNTIDTTADEKPPGVPALDAVELKCWICDQAAVGVRASALGAISGAYCLECLSTGREPWSVLVGGLMGCERGQVGNWVTPVIEATLAFYEKTEDDLWAAVEQAGANYEKHCQEEAAPNEWRCGRCGHEMPDTYDAGCDKCGAGNDTLVHLGGSED